jgi:hypothetical protein
LSCTLEDLSNHSAEFFRLHWPSAAGPAPTWSRWEFVGAIPGQDYQGVYALVSDTEVLYVGVGAGRNPGRYAGAGLGARLKRYFRLSPGQTVPISERRYEPTTPWPNAHYDSIHALALPKDLGYLALSLEGFLIDRLKPTLNVNRPGGS